MLLGVLCGSGGAADAAEGAGLPLPALREGAHRGQRGVVGAVPSPAGEAEPEGVHAPPAPARHGGLQAEARGARPGELRRRHGGVDTLVNDTKSAAGEPREP
eukprot:8302884-Pyramimonas_sp.AAC.1